MIVVFKYLIINKHVIGKVSNDTTILQSVSWWCMFLFV